MVEVRLNIPVERGHLWGGEGGGWASSLFVQVELLQEFIGAPEHTFAGCGLFPGKESLSESIGQERDAELIHLRHL